ncbi:6419_t:CDS:10, partial [Acaulospora colombiana]
MNISEVNSYPKDDDNNLYPILPKKDLPFRPWNAKALDLDVKVADPSRTDIKVPFNDHNHQYSDQRLTPGTPEIIEGHRVYDIKMDTTVNAPAEEVIMVNFFGENPKITTRLDHGELVQSKIMDEKKQASFITNNSNMLYYSLEQYLTGDHETSRPRSNSVTITSKSRKHLSHFPTVNREPEEVESKRKPSWTGYNAVAKESKHAEYRQQRFLELSGDHGKRFQRRPRNNSTSDFELISKELEGIDISSGKNRIMPWESSSESIIAPKYNVVRGSEISVSAGCKGGSNKNPEWSQPNVSELAENVEIELINVEGDRVPRWNQHKNKKNYTDISQTAGNARTGWDEREKIGRQGCDHTRVSQAPCKVGCDWAGEKPVEDERDRPDIFQVADGIKPGWEDDAQEGRKSEWNQIKAFKEFNEVGDDWTGEKLTKKTHDIPQTTCHAKSGWVDNNKSRESEWWNQPKVSQESGKVDNEWANKKEQNWNSEGLGDREPLKSMDCAPIPQNNKSGREIAEKERSYWDPAAGVKDRWSDAANMEIREEKRDNRKISTWDVPRSPKVNAPWDVQAGWNNPAIRDDSHSGSEDVRKITEWGHSIKEIPGDSKSRCTNVQWTNAASTKERAVRRTSKGDVEEFAEKDDSSGQRVQVNVKSDKVDISQDIADSRAHSSNPTKQSRMPTTDIKSRNMLQNETSDAEVKQLMFDGSKFVPESGAPRVETLVNLEFSPPAPATILPSSKLPEELKQINFEEYIKQEMEKEVKEARRKSQDPRMLEPYLQANIPEFKAPLEVRQFKFGQSNPTYLLIDANKRRYVLRKKPSGVLLSAIAHAVEREYRILDALGRNTDIPVPKVYLLCEDSNTLDTPFYVMEFLEGRVFEDLRLLSLSPEDRRKCWYSAIEVLAKLHSVDYKAIGLGTFGKSSGFYPRQIRSLLRTSAAQAVVKDKNGNQVGPLPRIDDRIRWFERNEVPDETTIVHGDYKLDNLVFHPTEPKVIGVLDWELSTIGHPLSDLANLLLNFYIKDSIGPLVGLRDLTDLPIPSADELMQFYCKNVGRPYPIPRFEYAIVFSFFRVNIHSTVLCKKQSFRLNTKLHDCLFVLLMRNFFVRQTSYRLSFKGLNNIRSKKSTSSHNNNPQISTMEKNMSKTKDILVETSYKGTDVYFRTTTEVFTTMELLSSLNSESFVLNDVKSGPVAVDLTEQKNTRENYDSDDTMISENLDNSVNSSLSFENFNDKDNTENVAEISHHRNVRRTFSISSSIENSINDNDFSGNPPTKGFCTLTRNGSVGSDILVTDRDHEAGGRTSANGWKGISNREELVGGKITTKEREGVDVELNGEVNQEQNDYSGCCRTEDGTKIVEKGKLQYLITLKNIRSPIWEYESHLINSCELVHNYWVRVGRSQLESINHPLVQFLKVPKDTQGGTPLSYAHVGRKLETGFREKNNNIESHRDLTPQPSNNKDYHFGHEKQGSCHRTRGASILFEGSVESGINLNSNKRARIEIEVDDSTILKALRETNTCTDIVEQNVGHREVETSLEIRSDENENVSGIDLHAYQKNGVVDRNSQCNITHKETDENNGNTETCNVNIADLDSLQSISHTEDSQERVSCKHLNESNIPQPEDSVHNDIAADVDGARKEPKIHISHYVNVNVDHKGIGESKIFQKEGLDFCQSKMDIEMDVDDLQSEKNSLHDESTHLDFRKSESNVKHSQVIRQESIKRVSVQVKGSACPLNSEATIVESHRYNFLREIASRNETHTNVEDDTVIDRDNIDTNMASTNQKSCGEFECKSLPTSDHNKESEEKNIQPYDTRKRKGEDEIDFRIFKLNPILPEDDEYEDFSEDSNTSTGNVSIVTNWDPYVECIETVQRDPSTKKLYMVIRWKNGLKTVHWADDANQKCPHK